MSTAPGRPPTSFKQDAWGTALIYSAANGTITSIGSGTPLVRKIANSVSDLTANSVTVLVMDISNVPPGPTLKDLISVPYVSQQRRRLSHRLPFTKRLGACSVRAISRLAFPPAGSGSSAPMIP